MAPFDAPLKNRLTPFPTILRNLQKHTCLLWTCLKMHGSTFGFHGWLRPRECVILRGFGLLPHTWCRTGWLQMSRSAHRRWWAGCCWGGSPQHTEPSLSNCSALWWPRACLLHQWLQLESPPIHKHTKNKIL